MQAGDLTGFEFWALGSGDAEIGQTDSSICADRAFCGAITTLGNFVLLGYFNSAADIKRRVQCHRKTALVNGIGYYRFDTQFLVNGIIDRRGNLLLVELLNGEQCALANPALPCSLIEIATELVKLSIVTDLTEVDEGVADLQA